MTGDVPAELVRDRELLTTELHPFNAFYGHGALFRRYAGWTRRGPLKASIEHGLVLVDDLVPELGVGVELPVFLCHAERRARAYLAQATRPARAEPIGVPILYADALAPPAPASGARRLVLFPAHSSRFLTSRYDVDEYLETVASWAREFDEVQVCLYWLDVRMGLDEPYRARGLPCVTAGHMYDPRFVFRLLRILRDATAVATNDLGTHVVYAAVLGRPVWVTGVAEWVHTDDAPPGARDPIERALRGDRWLFERLASTFAEPNDALSDEQRELAEELGGTRHVRTPAEIHAFLEAAEAAYRTLPLSVRAAYAGRAAARLARNSARQARLWFAPATR